MKIRPLYDRVVIKRVEEKEMTLCEAVCIFPIPRKKNPRRVK